MHASAGYVTVAAPGTLVRATVNLPVPTAHVSCHAILFEALPGNVGNVYIGNAGFSRTTGVEALGYVAIPTVNFAPSFSVAITLAPNALALEQYYIDADEAGDGVLISYLVL